MQAGRKIRRCGIAAALLAAVALWLSARLSAQEQAAGLVTGGEKPDLFLLYTGDVIGYVEPCG